MKIIIILLSFSCGLNTVSNFCCAQNVDSYKNNQSLTYDEVTKIYRNLENTYQNCRLFNYGLSDVGKPIYLMVISKDKDFAPSSIHKHQKTVLLINNGIHAGEPCGIDASAKLATQLLQNPNSIPQNTVICIIPVYNVGGALNRNCCSRSNQVGPELYGFRGNGSNLDLNRDLIKCDANNSFVFEQIFQDWDPDVFIDTHTSDGADYQYVMTYIATQHNKLNPLLANLMDNDLLPYLNRKMEDAGYPLIPYVESYKDTPDKGIVAYLETPRYTTGYAALFNTIAFVTEAHMLKPYEQRVEGTIAFLQTTVNYMENNGKSIISTRVAAKKQTKKQTKFALRWELDTTRMDNIPFLGYEYGYKKSHITGLQRLYYDRSKPKTYTIPYYNYYTPVDTITAPVYYIIPQAWHEVITRFTANNITMQRLTVDTSITVTSYFIRQFNTIDHPYEGHYLHTSVNTETKESTIQYHKGDYVVKANQIKNRYIVETLEPTAVDGFFVWNFFDEILQQKEWFSPYVFEEKTEKILKDNPELEKQFEEKQAEDSTFAHSDWQQLNFIYQHSENFEESYQRYPISRVEKEVSLPVAPAYSTLFNNQ